MANDKGISGQRPRLSDNVTWSEMRISTPYDRNNPVQVPEDVHILKARILTLETENKLILSRNVDLGAQIEQGFAEAVKLRAFVIDSVSGLFETFRVCRELVAPYEPKLSRPTAVKHQQERRPSTDGDQSEQERERERDRDSVSDDLHRDASMRPAGQHSREASKTSNGARVWNNITYGGDLFHSPAIALSSSRDSTKSNPPSSALSFASGVTSLQYSSDDNSPPNPAPAPTTASPSTAHQHVETSSSDADDDHIAGDGHIADDDHIADDEAEIRARPTKKGLAHLTGVTRSADTTVPPPDKIASSKGQRQAKTRGVVAATQSALVTRPRAQSFRGTRTKYRPMSPLVDEVTHTYELDLQDPQATATNESYSDLPSLPGDSLSTGPEVVFETEPAVPPLSSPTPRYPPLPELSHSNRLPHGALDNEPPHPVRPPREDVQHHQRPTALTIDTGSWSPVSTSSRASSRLTAISTDSGYASSARSSHHPDWRLTKSSNLAKSIYFQNFQDHPNRRYHPDSSGGPEAPPELPKESAKLSGQVSFGAPADMHPPSVGSALNVGFQPSPPVPPPRNFPLREDISPPTSPKRRSAP
ncbi:hypothetical protein JAAARDRAFT_192409 [Jaapia argillacea MUCL 33604]|uniref:Uncharacterized protein n=1 Tax=Jaapia argillacea MUCL 33604 TaxID=933084 RepID=A0A067Q1G3_9AGAM|nr:hypothetical protein JAAARDRAFT_192409 [Jaapia argillacea MUCL 33604]